MLKDGHDEVRITASAALIVKPNTSPFRFSANYFTQQIYAFDISFYSAVRPLNDDYCAIMKIDILARALGYLFYCFWITQSHL